MRMRVGLCVLLCGLWSASVSAQTPCLANCTLTVGQTYTLQADHDGIDTTGYRVVIDGAQAGADLPLSVLSGGIVTVSGLSAPSRGTHSIQLVAFNEDASAASDALGVTVKRRPPGKPGATRIVATLTLVVHARARG